MQLRYFCGLTPTMNFYHKICLYGTSYLNSMKLVHTQPSPQSSERNDAIANNCNSSVSAIAQKRQLKFNQNEVSSQIFAVFERQHPSNEILQHVISNSYIILYFCVPKTVSGIVMLFVYLFIYHFIAQVLKVCRTPGPTAF